LTHIDAHTDEHTHGGVHDPNAHHSPEEIRKEVRKYLIVFFVLACLTVVTVAISYLHLPPREAIAVALLIASMKAFLVAGYFMHLLSERKLIYAVLAITVFFFSMLLWAPWNHHYDYFGR
jgi:cytochrome c oxidase subunit 4